MITASSFPEKIAFSEKYSMFRFIVDALVMNKETPAQIEKTEKALQLVLLTAGWLLVFVGLSALVDIQGTLASAGVVILTVTEANELTAIYGGLFVVLGALCLFAKSRTEDRQLVEFIALAFLFVAAMRVYAAARHGMPEISRIHFSLGIEIVFGAVIFVLNRKAAAARE